MFLLEKQKKLAIVGQVRDVKVDVACDKGFEGGFAVHEAPGKAEEQQRPGPSQNEEGVDEGIGFDEGSIEVDAERLRLRGFEIRLNLNLGQRFTSIQASFRSDRGCKRRSGTGGSFTGHRNFQPLILKPVTPKKSIALDETTQVYKGSAWKQNQAQVGSSLGKRGLCSVISVC
jgi:hypothetical protein